MTLEAIEQQCLVHLLEYSDEGGMVTVTPKDRDRFSIQLNRAIEILQRAAKAEQFRSQFSLLLRTLAEWLKSRDDVQSAHVTLRDGSLLFLVMRKSADYDEAFEDELSDLDVAIANDTDLDLIRLNIMSLPCVSNDGLRSFLDPNLALTYFRHADR